MSVPDFFYQAFRKSKGSPEMTTLIASSAPADSPLRAVLWHASRKQWTYAPAIAAGLLFDDMKTDESVEVDRTTAEQIAREQLNTELPPPETLRMMSEEGATMGWNYGPPRT
jgi:hypothetical protein